MIMEAGSRQLSSNSVVLSSFPGFGSTKGMCVWLPRVLGAALVVNARPSVVLKSKLAFEDLYGRVLNSAGRAVTG